jgi:hypothetical protein
MAYKLQHLSLAGILDQSIAILKDHFGLLFCIMLLFQVPGTILFGYWSEGIAVGPPENATQEQRMQYSLEVFKWLPYFYLGLFIYSIFVVTATNAVVIPAVARLYLGQPTSLMIAMKHGFSRFLPLLATSILMWLPIWIGFFLCFLPGVLFFVWFGLGQHVVLIEGISGPRALGRSRRLTNPNWLQFLALFFMLLIISIPIRMVVQFIPGSLLRVVIGAMIGAVLTMWGAAAWVVYYFSCRCGVEHFDLHMLAESIGVTTSQSVEGEFHSASR